MNNNKSSLPLFKLLFAFGFFIAISCHNEEFTFDPNSHLRLEEDTITFDTVFSTIGSATRSIKIYNPNNKSIRIDRAYIQNGKLSDFKINLDGISGSAVENVEIRAGDSIYLFCEVTVRPNDPVEISPFIKTDSLFFEYNGTKQKLVLLAWGQNANYFPSKLNRGMVSIIDLQGSTVIWDDPRPYIIYGIVYFENGKLLIPAGTNVHVWGGLTKATDSNGNTFFYNDGRIIIGPNASIQVLGTKGKPVIFQGVRLESNFQNTPGQWSGIFLEKNSINNEFNYAVIKNNLIGLYTDSLSECTLSQTKIFNNSLYGLYSSTSTIRLINCLFYNQGSSSIYINTGGTYEVTYCTIVNFGNSEPGVYLSNARCIDFPFCTVIHESKLKSNFYNTVITGSDDDELWMAEKKSSPFEIQFQNCLFRIKDLTKEFSNFISLYTKDCIEYNYLNSLFKDLSSDDFHPDTLSVLEQKALPINGIQFDIEDHPRDVLRPDIGCYEYKPN